MVACKRKSDEREYSSHENLRDTCTLPDTEAETNPMLDEQ